MPLGNTARKLQKVADTAEDLYAKLGELREQVTATREAVEETSHRLDRLEAEAAEQRALLEAIAEKQDVDLDAVAATAHIGEAEADEAADSEADTTAESGTEAGADEESEPADDADAA